MSEKKKKDTPRPDEAGGVDYAKVYEEAVGQAGAKTRFDLVDLLAVGMPVELPITPGVFTPVPVTYKGHDYAIGRVYTGAQVQDFFDLLRTKGLDVSVPVLQKVLTEGDAEQLWADIGARNVYESNRLFEGIYKIAGLMSLSGKFLAS